MRGILFRDNDLVPHRVCSLEDKLKRAIRAVRRLRQQHRELRQRIEDLQWELSLTRAQSPRSITWSGYSAAGYSAANHFCLKNTRYITVYDSTSNW